MEFGWLLKITFIFEVPQKVGERNGMLYLANERYLSSETIDYCPKGLLCSGPQIWKLFGVSLSV